nr:557_t:CDS:2 [Entrophospora candida]
MQISDEALIQWAYFFKVEQFDDNPGCYIETDGFLNKNLDLTGKNIVIVGLDPGRYDLFVSADTNDNIAKCPTKEYYYLANFTRNREK